MSKQDISNVDTTETSTLETPTPAVLPTLRRYQTEAVQAVIQHFRNSVEPVVVVLPTGAGKSLVIAELGRLAHGRVLVLAHVKELVSQNHEKYEALGLRGDIFAAGLQRKESQRKVVFGSVQSVARNLQEFDDNYSLLIVDECHRIADDEDTQYQQIFRHILGTNPQLKILGLTATPYRLETGWIYKYHHKGYIRSEKPCFFYSCVYELSLQSLIEQQYLTPAIVMDGLVAQYNFFDIQRGPTGIYNTSDLQRVVQNSRRVTPQIIEQVIQIAQHRKGVMIFASTVSHAQEILGYLPAQEAGLIIGDTSSQERDALIQAFKQQQIRYLVNVSVLTTGFDAPHVDLIVLMRPTESVSLFQQMVGRGLRLFPGKTDCLVLDYANNGYNLFSPEIGGNRPHPQTEPVEVPCPLCGFVNSFWGKCDEDGDIIEHYGRRCKSFTQNQGKKVQCTYRFRFKECDHCGAENDIAARQCHQCRQILVDPDKKLKDALKARHTKVLRCSWMDFSIHQHSKGETSLKITYYDEDGSCLHEYFRFDTEAQRGAFFHHFVRLHHKVPGQHFWVQTPSQVIEQRHKFRHPNFIIARKEDSFWRILHKIFDYDGNFRTADSAG